MYNKTSPSKFALGVPWVTSDPSVITPWTRLIAGFHSFVLIGVTYFFRSSIHSSIHPMEDDQTSNITRTTMRDVGMVYQMNGIRPKNEKYIPAIKIYMVLFNIHMYHWNERHTLESYMRKKKRRRNEAAAEQRPACRGGSFICPSVCTRKIRPKTVTLIYIYIYNCYLFIFLP